jgi:nucleoside-diphosphate-sugar epimerase
MSRPKLTVLGGNGYIGRRMVSYLKSLGFEVEVPARDIASLQGQHLGNIIYAIGLTGDFRSRPYDTVQAHVDVLGKILQGTSFDSLLYLSSTRVYGGIRDKECVTEDDALKVYPSADAVYDLSKLLGESLCLQMKLPTVRIARLSNVYGPDLGPNSFLGSVFRDLVLQGHAVIQETLDSSKDYISVDDIVPLLASIALEGKARTYNLSSGRPVTHGDLAALITEAGYRVTFMNAAIRSFPRIDNLRVVKEFDFSPRSLLDDMPALLARLKE